MIPSNIILMFWPFPTRHLQSLTTSSIRLQIALAKGKEFEFVLKIRLSLSIQYFAIKTLERIESLLLMILQACLPNKALLKSLNLRMPSPP